MMTLILQYISNSFNMCLGITYIQLVSENFGSQNINLFTKIE